MSCLDFIVLSWHYSGYVLLPLCLPFSCILRGNLEAIFSQNSSKLWKTSKHHFNDFIVIIFLLMVYIFYFIGQCFELGCSVFMVLLRLMVYWGFLKLELGAQFSILLELRARIKGNVFLIISFSISHELCPGKGHDILWSAASLYYKWHRQASISLITPLYLLVMFQLLYCC